MTAALANVPSLPNLALSEDERALWNRLRRRLSEERRTLELLDLYYNGEQRMTTTGVSLPPELAGMRQVPGWARLAVDPMQDRLSVEGFRYPGAVDADDDMWTLWQDSNLDSESDLAHTDGLLFGRSYVVVGTEDDGRPLITVESPLNMTHLWDARARHPRVVLQHYDVDDDKFAAIYLPDQTITLGYDGRRWEITGRDVHRLGWPLVMVMANRARAHDRGGRSEITPEVRTIVDAGCRTLLDLEVSREFYAAPQRYILGAAESAFQDAKGNPKSAWETYRGRVLALERDEEGNVPEVGSFAAYDPSAYTRVIDTYAEIMASMLGLPPSYLGKTTDQPASADAIRMSTDRLVQKVRRRQRSFEVAWEGAIRMALAFRDGQIPDPARRIETIWRAPEIPTPAATTDALQKQVAMGYMPPRSDVAGEALGYTPLQRARIAAEWDLADGDADLQALLAASGPDNPGPASETEEAAAEAEFGP